MPKNQISGGTTQPILTSKQILKKQIERWSTYQQAPE